MSIRVMTTVWDQSAQKGSALLLLLSLADHAADDGFCWPGVERLAQKIRMSERSVTRLLKNLEDDGELYVIRQNGQHNWYVVRVGMTDQDVIGTLKKRGMATPDNLSPLTTVSEGTDTGDRGPLTQLCHANRHEPSANRHKTPPLADSSEPDDIAEIEASFKTPPPRTPRTAEQCKAGVRRAIETYASNGGRPGVADPTHEADPWLCTAQEFSALIVTPFENVPDSRRRLWIEDIQEIADSSETGKGPEEVSGAIRAIAMDEDYKWLRKCNRPTHQGFANALLNVLCGQALSGGTASGAGTPRTREGGTVVISSDAIVMGKAA